MKLEDIKAGDLVVALEDHGVTADPASTCIRQGDQFVVSALTDGQLYVGCALSRQHLIDGPLADKLKVIDRGLRPPDEIDAMRQIKELLDPFDPVTRGHIIDWIASRFGE